MMWGWRGLSVGLVGLLAWMLWPIGSSLAWATVAAVVIWPMRRHVWSYPWAARHSKTTAALMAIGVAAGLLLPLIGAVWVLVADLGTQAWDWAQAVHWPVWWDETWRMVPAWAWPWKAAAQRALLNTVTHLRHGADVWDNVWGAGANLLKAIEWAGWFMLFLAMWLHDGGESPRRWAGVAEQHGGALWVRAVREALSTVRGQGVAWVVLGVVESLAIGAGLRVMGVGHPWVFGVISGVGAPLPGVSPTLIALIALWAWIHGRWIVALAAIVWGALVFLVFDSWARPWLASQHSNVPLGWSLIGVVLGLQAWGPLGIFAGPALLSAMLVVLSGRLPATEEDPHRVRHRPLSWWRQRRRNATSP